MVGVICDLNSIVKLAMVMWRLGHFGENTVAALGLNKHGRPENPG
jgi:hypothetical protein